MKYGAEERNIEGLSKELGELIIKRKKELKIRNRKRDG